MARKRIKLEITEHEFGNIVDMAETLAAMKGAGESFTDMVNRQLKSFKAALKRNSIDPNQFRF